MSERGNELLSLAERQIDELVDLISAGDESALHQPCPGRQKLGDGSVAALATHTITAALQAPRTAITGACLQACQPHGRNWPRSPS